LLTLQYVRNPNYGTKSAASDIDWLGIALLAASVGSLQYVLEKGQDDDWFSNTAIIILSCTAFLGAFFFIWRELTFRNPIVNLRVLKNGNLRIGTGLTFLLGFGLYGSTFIIPVYTQSILGWTAFQSGMLMVPAAITTAFLMPIVGLILSKGVPQQFMVSMGMLIFAIFCFWGYFILTNSTPEQNFFWMLVMRGLGLPLLFIPITSLSLQAHSKALKSARAWHLGMMRQSRQIFRCRTDYHFMARQNIFHRSTLVSKLSVDDPAVTSACMPCSRHLWRRAFRKRSPSVCL
jgi:DHA2 family multidrug resistance protein